MSNEDNLAHGGATPQAVLHESETRLRVIRGTPTIEERAAIEAVLVSMASEWRETKHRRVLDRPNRWERGTKDARDGIDRRGLR